MQKKITLRLSPSEAENTEAIKRYIAAYADVFSSLNHKFPGAEFLRALHSFVFSN